MIVKGSVGLTSSCPPSQCQCSIWYVSKKYQSEDTDYQLEVLARSLCKLKGVNRTPSLVIIKP